MRESCPPSPLLTRTPPGFCTTISGIAGSEALNFVTFEVITGMMLEAGSRKKIEASRVRARVNAKVRKSALEGVMGSKKAAHAYLKGSETTNTPALLGKDRRDCETLFDAQCIGAIAEWDSDKQACPRAEAAKAEHARPPISDRALARAVALLRNKRGIGTDHWTLLELKALHEVAIASLANIVMQVDVRLTIHAAVSQEPELSVVQARWWREAHCAPISVARSVEQLPC